MGGGDRVTRACGPVGWTGASVVRGSSGKGGEERPEKKGAGWDQACVLVERTAGSYRVSAPGTTRSSTVKEG